MVKGVDVPEPNPQRARPVMRQQAKLGDQVYEAILTDIVKGRYLEGSKLPTETALADEFSVSRPVVREALARLRDDGLIQPRQGAGSFVVKRPGSALLRFAPIGSIADIQRCFEFRIAVEPMAARLAATRRDKAMLNTISDLLDAQESAAASDMIDVDSDFRFHKAVADASGNSYFSTTLYSLEESMKTAMLLNRQLSLQNPRKKLHLRQAEHKAIFEAISASDADAAHEAMHNHIDVARRRIFDGEVAV
ncbi:MAG TPA: FadR/GntR family transcriptional regulator [Rhizobiaceae bacterium]|nr:FadR/GntR family transcriptional regulator [Rhizobiaceae bacterium]